MSFPSPFYRWRPHPWHGLEVGLDPPTRVNAYIEITPFDGVKYEIDKVTGYLLVDRPQPYSSSPPALYGFIPRTYCGPRVAALAEVESADGDPLDICVLSERPINRSEVVLRCRVVGGLQTVDQGEADDKIIAVLDSDAFWRETHDIGQIPEVLVSRIRHYFQTYKQHPGRDSKVEVRSVYGQAQAHRVVAAAASDYEEAYGS